MRHRRLALTGPAAAALYQLDGFRDYKWPHSWCVPWGNNTYPGDRTVQARRWEVPQMIGDIPVCSVELVVRHLHAFPTDLVSRADGIAPIDRVELAVEHILRLGHTLCAARGGSMSGDALLRSVLLRRGNNVPRRVTRRHVPSNVSGNGTFILGAKFRSSRKVEQNFALTS